jgi:hypothetical protein
VLPPHIFPQGLPVDVHPHPYGPAPPPPQTLGATHVFVHVTGCPQLLTVLPHALPAQVVVIGSGTQQAVPTHTCPLGQFTGQPTVWPQLFTTFSLHLFAHAAPLFGVQHVSLDSHTSPTVAHDCDPEPPQ